MIRMAIIAVIVLAPSLATPQIVPYRFPDGTVYWRRAPTQPQPLPPPVTRQQYIPAPPDIIAPERPRGSPRQRDFTPPIEVVPLDPLPPEPDAMTPEPAPEPTVTVTPSAPEPPNPLLEWCRQEANAKVPLCRNVASPRVQR
jgi:hypothetical protein